GIMRNLRENLPSVSGNREASTADKKQLSDQGSASSSAPWKMHSWLGETVRFTRTPEVELAKRRGESLPEINSRASEPKVATDITAETTQAAQAQPMAVAALQNTVTQNLVRTPVAPVPPLMPSITTSKAAVDKTAPN